MLWKTWLPWMRAASDNEKQSRDRCDATAAIVSRCVSKSCDAPVQAINRALLFPKTILYVRRRFSARFRDCARWSITSRISGEWLWRKKLSYKYIVYIVQSQCAPKVRGTSNRRHARVKLIIFAWISIRRSRLSGKHTSRIYMDTITLGALEGFKARYFV